MHMENKNISFLQYEVHCYDILKTNFCTLLGKHFLAENFIFLLRGFILF